MSVADWRTELDRPDILLVLRGTHPAGPVREEPAAASPDPEGHGLELFLSVDADGRVTGYNGHVDLGTGIATALAQIVAEELDVSLDAVTMVLGHSRQVPSQGATIASETIQVTAVPLRKAAAQARHHLVGLAATAFGVPINQLAVADGVVRDPAGNRHASYGELLRGRLIRLLLDDATAVKPVEQHRIVGRPVPRRDIPDKVAGRFTYVHDVRLPGMLHGRVVRPPYAGLDHGPFVGRSLVAMDRPSIAHLPGIVAVVVEGDFIGVVAEREEQAAVAAETLKTRWRGWEPGPDLSAPEAALRANPSTPRVLLERGDADAALAAAATPMRRTYTWPYQLHGSIGPSCAVADVSPDGATVWSGTQNPLMLRTDIAKLLGLAEEAVAIVRHEAAGCYGRNCADDVSADAALLSRAVGRPVRVQLTREQEHAWEPKGAAQVMDVAGGLDAAGDPAAYLFDTRYPSNAAPTLALLLTGRIPPEPATLRMGDRTAVPPYAYDHTRITVHDMAPIARAAWLRGVSAMPNSFAHESFIDELATEAGVDPVDYRLRHLPDARAAELVRSVAARAGWVPHTRPQTLAAEGDWLRGRGFAYATYVHGTFPGVPAASAAWVADVAVHRDTGEVLIDRITVGQDSGMVVNPAGVEHQIHGNVIQSISRALKEEVAFSDDRTESRDWGTYPLLGFADLPSIDVIQMPRQHEPPLGVGESASVPSAAAIANAIFDATGVRFRDPPFTAQRVRAALQGLPPPTDALGTKAVPTWKGARLRLGALAGVAAGALGLVAIAIPSRSAIPPVPRPDVGVFSAATIERGRLVAAAGGCANCHADADGLSFSGGHALHTPFGTIWASNITPDTATGIGAWSYPAFERAMREGVSRDGHNLYPAHPYTSYTHVADADLQALYAYLMAQASVAQATPVAALAAPFDRRALMRVWNAMFLHPGPLAAEPARSAAWNRGRELVEGLGHCSACHSPRNVLGAERGGAAHLGGGVADGWDAPALTQRSKSPVPWTAEAFHQYLTKGYDRDHGVAAGPMAAVVRELAALPDDDRRAMADYLASLGHDGVTQGAAARAAAEARARATKVPVGLAQGAAIYTGACAMCHEATGPMLFGARPDLAVNTSVHADRPDNLIRVLLEGIMDPAHPDLGAMPGFSRTYNDGQIAALVNYVRTRFAPDKAKWHDLDDDVRRLRTEVGRGAPSDLVER